MRLFLWLFCALALGSATLAAEEIDIKFINGYDRTTQEAMGFVPDDVKTKTEPRPLLVVAHFMGGGKATAKKLGYYEEAAKRGWMVVCPQLHGKNTSGETSCAAIEAQHDVIGAIDYMKKNYPVDPQRIYIAGRSMGGMLTQLMIAKYPDIFAAGVAGQGCADLSDLNEYTDKVVENIRKECGNDPFEYLRRSPVQYAPNFAYCPIILWHGSGDGIVSAKQTQELYNAIKPYQPFIRPVDYLANMPHMDMGRNPAWICEQLAPYKMNSDWKGFEGRWYPELKLVTDEVKSFFYIRLFPAQSGKLARISTKIVPLEEGKRFEVNPAISNSNMLQQLPVQMIIVAENLQEIVVDLDRMPESYQPKQFKVITKPGDIVPVVKTFRSGGLYNTKPFLPQNQ